MIIQFTAEDIATGQRQSCVYCPIARAIQRATGEPSKVDNYHAYVRFHRPIPLPVAAQRFVHAFDIGQKVVPFEFDLRWTEQEGGEAPERSAA